MADLRTSQRWLLDVVAHPDGVPAGLEAAAVHLGTTHPRTLIAPGPHLSPEDQLHVYAYMYFERQLEVLDHELPTTRFLLGPDPFRALVRAYLQVHPSTHPSLDRLGHAFADFLAGQPDELPHRDLAVSLARVERVMDELLDDPYDPLATPEQFEAVPASSWAELRLVPVRALRLLALSHPVRRFMDAHRDRAYLQAPAAAPTWAAVFRGRDDVIWRAEWPRERFELLARLQAGATLGEALQAVVTAPWADGAAVGRQVRGWFRSWMEDGIFRALDPRP
jgi:hypothetical protein